MGLTAAVLNAHNNNINHGTNNNNINHSNNGNNGNNNHANNGNNNNGNVNGNRRAPHGAGTGAGTPGTLLSGNIERERERESIPIVVPTTGTLKVFDEQWDFELNH